MNKILTTTPRTTHIQPSFYNLYTGPHSGQAGGDRCESIEEALRRRVLDTTGCIIKIEVTPEKDFLITTVKEFK